LLRYVAVSRCGSKLTVKPGHGTDEGAILL
jgi:hypothetical protein